MKFGKKKIAHILKKEGLNMNWKNKIGTKARMNFMKVFNSLNSRNLARHENIQSVGNGEGKVKANIKNGKSHVKSGASKNSFFAKNLGIIILLTLVSFIFLFSSFSVVVFAETNISLWYGWNGSQWIPIRVANDGTLMTDLNLTESIGISPKANNSYSIGTAALRWASGYFTNMYAGTLKTVSGSLTLAPTTGTVDIYKSGTDMSLLINNATGSSTIQLNAGADSYILGNVGIGTTAPQTKLDIHGGGSDHLLNITDGTNDAMFIDNTGNVGIGTTSPLAKVHAASTASGVTPHANADEIFADNSANTGITIAAGTSSSGTIAFADTGDNMIGRIVYDNSVNDLSFGTAGVADRMVIDSSGNVGIGTTAPNVGGWTNSRVLTIRNPSGSGEIPAVLELVADTASGGTSVGAIQFSYHGDYSRSEIAGLRHNLGDESALIFKTEDAGSVTTKMIITNLGRVGIGTTSPDDGKVEVKGGTVCVDTNSDDSATSCIASESDIRLKKNIKPIENALEKIMELEGVEFDWRWDEYEQIQRFKAKPHGIGLVAQDVEKVFPDALNEDIGEFKSVNYDALVPPLIEAVKELRAEKDDEIAHLRTENNALKKLVCLDHPEAEICQ